MALPTFLVIGAAKSGTTSLHRYLRGHPEIFVPAVKETNYFWTEAATEGRRTPRTLHEYERLFARADGRRAVGEVSPRYLTSPGAAVKIRAELPEVRLVVCLREPVQRAWSDYLGQVRIGREARTFAEAVAPGEPCFERGLYRAQLERYYARFPPERIHVMLHERLAADTSARLRELFAFLGVDPDPHIDTSARLNVAAAPRSKTLNRMLWPAVEAASRLLPAYRRGTGLAARALALTYRPPPPIPAETAQSLRRRYAEDVRATAELIGRDLSHWM